MTFFYLLAMNRFKITYSAAVKIEVSLKLMNFKRSPSTAIKFGNFIEINKFRQ